MILAPLGVRWKAGHRGARSRRECADALAVKIGTFDVVLLRALRSFRDKREALEDASAMRVDP